MGASHQPCRASALVTQPLGHPIQNSNEGITVERLRTDEISAGKLEFVLWAVCGAIWIWCTWFQISVKSSFLDDSFIYLHLASNVVEEGTARCFPIAESRALLASSPLRLMVLVPATLVARLFTDVDRSVGAARLTLVLSGLISSLIFLPFFRKNMNTWLIGFAAAGLFGLSTETGLQMEGLLVFWLVFTTLATMPSSPPDTPYFRRLAVLVGLMILTRPEYGAAAMVLAAFYLLLHRSARNTLAFFLPVFLIGVSWIGVARVLGVYPIPTSILSKILTADLGLFQGGRFWESFPDKMKAAFFASANVPFWAAGVGAVAALAAIALSGRRFWWALAFIAIVSIEETKAPGNYLWYHENLFIVFVTVCGFALVKNIRSLPKAVALALCVLTILPVAGFAASGLGRDRVMFWNFKTAPSRATAYQMVGKYADGLGTFQFPQLGRCSIVMNEIGIAAYFGGTRIWVIDNSGLAQPGTPKTALRHWVSKFYPRDVLRSGIEEMQFIKTKFNYGIEKPPLFFAQGVTTREDAKKVCSFYAPKQGLCLETMESVKRRSVIR